jgi:hypothetical protein
MILPFIILDILESDSHAFSSDDGVSQQESEENWNSRAVDLSDFQDLAPPMSDISHRNSVSARKA